MKLDAAKYEPLETQEKLLVLTQKCNAYREGSEKCDSYNRIVAAYKELEQDGVLSSGAPTEYYTEDLAYWDCKRLELLACLAHTSAMQAFKMEGLRRKEADDLYD